MLRDRVVVVGVSGGIAAYKACELVRRLRDRGATVLVVMTKAACEFVTPLTFLGGAFYSISMLPPVWQKITLFNPVVYLISGFRWSFYGISDVDVVVSAGMTLGFLVLCLTTVWWIFRTGYKLKA